MDVESDIELYESDVLRLKDLARTFNSRFQGTWHRPEVVATELTERFAELGYRVDLAMRHSEMAAADYYQFGIRITGRIEPVGEFDHERQAREVRAAEGVDPSGLKDPDFGAALRANRKP